MAFFFRNKQSKMDMVKTAKDLLIRLRQPPQLTKTEEELGNVLAAMKSALQGTHETHSTPEALTTLVRDMQTHDFAYLLASSVHLLRFESRKDSQAILSCALRYRAPATELTPEEETPGLLVHIIKQRPEVVLALCQGYEHRESAMPCGAVLREILKNEDIPYIIFYDEDTVGSDKAFRRGDVDIETPQSGNGIFWRFFDWINNASFEASTDAFSTFRELLTRHKAMAAHYLTVNFDLFFEKYNGLLIQSKSYVTKRQSIKLLGEILLDRANYNVMTQYVDKGEHLKLCMNLLKDERKMVQYEGFHVFKVFVANPNKSEAVKKILIRNRDQLLKFLPTFLEDRQDDDQFLDEKSFLIRQISMLPANSAAA